MSRPKPEGKSESRPVVSSTANTHLAGARLYIARTVWFVLVIPSLGLCIASLLVSYQQLQSGGIPAQAQQSLSSIGLSVSGFAALTTSFNVITTAIWYAVGFFIFWRRSDDRLALLAAFMLVMFNVTSSSNNNAPVVLTLAYPVLSLPLSLMNFLGSTSLALFFLLFPGGWLVPRWMRLILLLLIVETFLDDFPSPSSPFDANWPGWLHLLMTLIIYGAILYSQIYRYRRVSTPVQRQQTKWVILGVTVAIGVVIGILAITYLISSNVNSNSFGALIFSIIWPAALLLIPLSIGFSILRYRLYDIDLLLNRTLVYGLLTACVISLYILVVVLLGTLFQVQGNFLISLVATGLIAVLFQPLRQRLQHVVNRVMYGERDDPYRVLSRLGQRLETTVAPEAILSTIVETVAQALKLPYVAITLQQDGELTVAASYGARAGGEELHLPLAYQTEQVGELVLAPRAPGEAFSVADRRLLEDLARQVDISAHAVRLTADLKRLTQDLQQARERLVSAREEERRRLRRDLHDGLGPQLSSQTLLLTSAQMLLRQDPDEAEAILKSAVTQSQQAISDIRRLAYALRPPALDALGLVMAIQEQLTQNRASGIAFSFDAPEQLPPLPAAVEVACYRIVQEAIINVVRHAHARNCAVHLKCDKQLTIEVIDDGQGLSPAYRCGVGLTSMRERAEELGGSWQIEPGPDGGTGVQAELPYR